MTATKTLFRARPTQARPTEYQAVAPWSSEALYALMGLTQASTHLPVTQRNVSGLTGVSAALLTQLPDAQRLSRELDHSFEQSVTIILIGVAMFAAGIWSLVVYVLVLKNKSETHLDTEQGHAFTPRATAGSGRR